MTTAVTEDIRHRPGPRQTTDGWVVSIRFDTRGRVFASGVPMASRATVDAFFDGVLFERETLAADLRVSPADHDNAMLVALAYERWREAAFDHLRGQFAVVIVDRARDLAIAVRDQAGLHPVFYGQCGRDWRVATSPSELVAAGVPKRLNRAALADHLCQRWPRREETFFESITRVVPGCRVTFTSTGADAARYWDPMPPDQPPRWLDEEGVAGFDAAFERAVRRCMSAGKTGLYLSGGLDSISVAAMAADLSDREGLERPDALSLDFPGSTSEAPRQTAVADRLGMPMHLLNFLDTIGPAGLLAQAADYNRVHSAPLINTWMPAYHKLAEVGAHSGCHMVMTGSGGDEWLGLSPYVGADYLQHLELRKFAAHARAWSQSYSYPSKIRFARAALWTYGLRPLAGLALNRVAPDAWQRSRSRRATASDPTWIAPDAALKAQTQARAQGALGDSEPSQGFYLREVRTALDHALTSVTLEEQYEYGKRAGVTFLHPYWDADLVDLLYRSPPDLLLRNSYSKGLVRDSVAKRFPDLGFESQRKVIATSYFRDTIFKEGPAMAKLYGTFANLGELGIVDARICRDELAQMFAAPSSPRNTSTYLHVMWNLLNVEAWTRFHVN